ncbi:MAG: serine hydrolase domain-containing protein [Gammaproteobacteria bacterium]
MSGSTIKRSTAGLVVAALTCLSSTTQAASTYDYFAANRTLISHGVQAVLTCNGLFTSNRTLKQVFDQELKYLSEPVGTVDGGDYRIDRAQKWVEVGSPPHQVRAAFRTGIGCVVMAPDQNREEVNDLPQQTLAPLTADAASVAWPDGDLIESGQEMTLALKNVDREKLQAASDWAFERDTPEQDTLSLLVIHDGQIVHERYAPGVDQTTRTRTWSTAKSIATTLIGMRMKESSLELDTPLNIDWLPKIPAQNDPRHDITLRHLMNMSSGLYPVDSFKMEYATGSGLAYWAGASSINGARNRALVAKPGTAWEYENYDTLLAVYAMKRTFKNTQEYLDYPRKALLDKIGMRNTLLSTDRFGDFILSSQVYTNARDLGRFGLLWLNDGLWHGEQLVDTEWIDFATTPAPASTSRHNDYGGYMWLVPDNRTDVPQDAYATAGNRGQYVIVVPSHNTVIVRRGLDYGRQGFNRWDLTREVLKAIQPTR